MKLDKKTFDICFPMGTILPYCKGKMPFGIWKKFPKNGYKYLTTSLNKKFMVRVK